MYFDYSDEQHELRSTVRRYLADVAPLTAARAAMESETGYDTAVWQGMARRLGLPGIHLPEEYGGSGGSFVELAIVFAELGRVLYTGPFLSTIGLAANLLLSVDDTDARADYLPLIAEGSLIATVAATEDTADRWPALDQVQATGGAGGYCLTGGLGYVLDGAVADLVFVPASLDGRLSLFAVETTASGVTREPLLSLDASRRFARVRLADASARLVGPPGGVADALATTLDLARVALAAEQVGGAQACLEMATEYAKQREQFGRVIGSFQAIKHKCADILVQVECAAAAAQYASWVAAEDRAQLPTSALVAAGYCAQAALFAAGENIQIHGGIGFTWEHSPHLYFKRAQASALIFGSVADHRERLAAAVLADQ
jgi:alkylation response protein AidB-like acyl-CoA dehydrogenase